MTPQSLLKIMEKVTDRGVIDTARRLATILRNILDEPVYLGLLKSNPAENLKRQLPKKTESKQFAHITDEKDLRKLLLAIDEVRPRRDFSVTMA